MAYKTKPELEEGNFIVYTNEPDTFVDSADIGGGGGEGGEEYAVKIVFKNLNGAVTLSDFDKPPVTVNGVSIELVEEGAEGNTAVAANFNASAFNVVELLVDSQTITSWVMTNHSVDLIPGIGMMKNGESVLIATDYFFMPPASTLRESEAPYQDIEITVTKE